MIFMTGKSTETEISHVIIVSHFMIEQVNTFQLVIVTDGESSFAIFQYLDGGMQWIKSQGKLTPTLPEIPAQAGFDSGSETTGFFLPGSGTTAAFVK